MGNREWGLKGIGQGLRGIGRKDSIETREGETATEREGGGNGGWIMEDRGRDGEIYTQDAQRKRHMHRHTCSQTHVHRDRDRHLYS